MKNLLKIAGILACVAALGLNLQYAMDGYGMKSGKLIKEVLAQASTSGTGSGSSNTRPKVKLCRQVQCNATITVTIKAGACVKIPVIGDVCATKADVEVTVNGIPGTTENCTGGSDYEDCSACQTQCVANP